MRVRVRLHGNLKRYARGLVEGQIELEDGATIRALLARLGVPEAEWWMVAIDERVVDEMAGLKEGDLVDVFEPVAGGARG